MVEIDIVPFNEFNAPGARLRDLFPERIINDVILIQGKDAKKRAQACKSRLISLNREFDQSLGNSKHAIIITDAAVPLLSTGHQAVAAWHVWYKGLLISSDWQAGGLALSNDTETFAIAGGFSALSDLVDLSDIEEIHVFSDSTNAIKHALDPSIHSAQESALETLFLITPWIERNNNCIFFHYVPDSADYVFEPH